MRTLFVCCGDPDPAVMSIHGPFARWFRSAIDPTVVLDEIDARATPLAPAHLDGFDAMVISGSPHAAYEPHPWIPALEATVRHAVNVRAMPVFGVCFGHQVVAQALGGKVTRNPRGREIGTTEIRVNDHGRASTMFAGLPDRLHVQLTHCDTVATPPPGARVLATSDRDECQAFEIGSAWCVQFHPEITAEIIRAYLHARRAVITSEGLDADGLLAGVRESDVGRTLFERFSAHVRGGALNAGASGRRRRSTCYEIRTQTRVVRFMRLTDTVPAPHSMIAGVSAALQSLPLRAIVPQLPPFQYPLSPPVLAVQCT